MYKLMDKIIETFVCIMKYSSTSTVVETGYIYLKLDITKKGKK